MSKKYRLKKWYPSLSKAMPVGFIMHKNEKLCNYSNLQHNFIELSSDEVENNPEFWELIKEKEWEILSFKYDSEYPIIANIQSNGSYQSYLPMTQSSGGSTLNEMLMASRWSIYSVKRLFDNEIFSVGNKIEHSYTDKFENKITKTYTIKKIYFLDTENIRFYVDEGLNFSLEKLKKYTPKALFITKDGVEIFKGDTYWYMNKSHFQLEKVIGPIECNKAPINIDLLYFSTQKAAMNYIDLNKPKYSEKDIQSAMYDVGFNTSSIASVKRRLSNFIK